MASGDFIINGGVLTKYVGAGGNVVIPDGVTVIGHSAFERCFGITSISIPYGVKSIGEDAFWGCKNLTTLVIPASVKEIGNGAFQGCLKLSSVTLPVALKNIGRTAFDGVPCRIVRKDVKNPSTGSSATRATSSNHSKTTPKTASSANKSQESSDGYESIITRFNRAIEKEPSYKKQAAATKNNSAVKASGSSSSAKTSTAPRTTSAPKTSAATPKSAASTPKTASAPATKNTSSTASSGDDFLSQVRQNAIENSPENVMRRKAEAKAQAEAEKRSAERHAAENEVLKLARNVKDEVLHYSPYYCHTNERSQQECTGEIVLEGVWESEYNRGTTSYIFHGVKAYVNWYGTPRMNKNEIPQMNKAYVEPDSWRSKVDIRRNVIERNNLISPMFFPDFNSSCKGFWNPKTVYTVKGETTGEKMFLRKLKEVFGAAVSFYPCAAEINEDKRSDLDFECEWYSFNAIILTKKYKFRFVF